jgi:tetratricopeptide (TPR) repeat protein
MIRAGSVRRRPLDAASCAFLGSLCLAAWTLGCAHKATQSGSAAQSTKKLSLAQLYMGEGQNYPEAIRILTELAKQEPKDWEVRHNLGIAKFGAADYAGAQETLKEALRIDPRRSETHYWLGVVQFAAGDSKGALESYRAALSDPVCADKEQVYLGIAAAYDAMGNTEEAIRHAQKSIEANPKFSAAHFQLAVLYDGQDRTREAIEEYEIAAPDYAADPNYHYRLGVAYFRAGKPEMARPHLSMVTESVPGTEKARKAKEFLEIIAAAAPPRSG